MSYEIISEQVLPLKNEAIQKAEQFAKKQIELYLIAMEDANWDLNRFIIKVEGSRYGHETQKYKLYNSLSTFKNHSRRPSEPNYRLRDIALEERFIKFAKENASLQYDAFIQKLVTKTGEIKSAELDGNHVWGHSYLTVENAEGEATFWKTQQIVNISKHGKLFNQYPTRKVKRKS